MCWSFLIKFIHNNNNNNGNDNDDDDDNDNVMKIVVTVIVIIGPSDLTTRTRLSSSTTFQI